jgi:hypothetical protein
MLNFSLPSVGLELSTFFNFLQNKSNKTYLEHIASGSMNWHLIFILIKNLQSFKSLLAAMAWSTCGHFLQRSFLKLQQLD